jgi:hypothetical protein
MADRTDKTTAKEKAVKALVHVRKRWVDESGAGEIFKTANANPSGEILVVPVTHFDISDRNFVEIIVWPVALTNHPVQSVKAFIPKHEVALIVELKSSEALPALGYRAEAGK